MSINLVAALHQFKSKSNWLKILKLTLITFIPILNLIALGWHIKNLNQLIINKDYNELPDISNKMFLIDLTAKLFFGSGLLLAIIFAILSITSLILQPFSMGILVLVIGIILAIICGFYELGLMLIFAGSYKFLDTINFKKATKYISLDYIVAIVILTISGGIGCLIIGLIDDIFISFILSILIAHILAIYNTNILAQVHHNKFPKILVNSQNETQIQEPKNLLG